MREKDLAVARLASADPRARELVNAVQSILAREMPDLKELQKSLIDLFQYLSSPNGRTDENCNAINSYFMFDDLWAKRNLPDHFHGIFADVAGTLHDTASAPEIAKNFDSTPEQLLKRARELNKQHGVVPNLDKLIIIWGVLDLLFVGWYIANSLFEGRVPIYSDFHSAFQAVSSFGQGLCYEPCKLFFHGRRPSKSIISWA